MLVECIFSIGHPVVSSKKSFSLFLVASAGQKVWRIPNYIVTKARNVFKFVAVDKQ